MPFAPPVRPACYVPPQFEERPCDVARRYRLRRAWGTAFEIVALAVFLAFILLMAAGDGATG